VAYSEFQIYMFNNDVEPVIKGSDGLWLKADDSTQLDEAIRVLRRTVPEKGTNMLAAWQVAATLSPPPDNIILLVDGLPTMDAPTTTQNTVSGRERSRMHFRALREHEAPIHYWVLANRTGGSFISVSRDWP